MAYDEATAERVRRLLDGRQVVEKRMVGGLSFMVDGSLCCGVTGAGLMVRVGSAALERTLAERHVQPMLLGGRRVSGFVCIEPAGYRSETALARWLQRALDFVSTIPARKPAKQRARQTTTKPRRGR